MNAGPALRLTEECFPALRRRLARDIHRRLYHDAGVEVSPGPVRADARSEFRVSTPHCLQGDRPLATLAWDGGTWPGPLRGTGYATWGQLRQASFAHLGVAGWATRRHLGCFHRRGKARYDLVFALASRLIEEAGPGRAADMWAVDRHTAGDDGVLALLRAWDEPLPADRPPRHLAVSCCGTPVCVLRGDGHAVTAGGPVALDRLWLAGADEADLARRVRAAAGHEHTDPPRR